MSDVAVKKVRQSGAFHPVLDRAYFEYRHWIFRHNFNEVMEVVEQDLFSDGRVPEFPFSMLVSTRESNGSYFIRIETLSGVEQREEKERIARLEAELTALREWAAAYREALEQYAEPTNWTSEATYTYEVPFSANSDGNPQEREGRVELGIPIVWQGDAEIPSTIARAVLAASAPQGTTEEK